MEEEVQAYSRMQGKEEFTHKPYRIVTKDGKSKWVEDMTFIRRNEEGDITHYEGVVLDITERIKAEEEKENLRIKLQRSQKMESIGLLAGGVAHDLNNILSAIVGYPELLLLDLPEDSKLRKPIATMQESGRRAAAVVQDLLTVARGVASTKEPLNMNDLANDYLKSPEFKKLKKYHPTVTVKTDLDAELFNIRGSQVHMRKIIMNLVSNASEAIEGSGTTFELYFPITREKLPVQLASIPIEDYRGNSETILVVDDVESQREIACNMLGKLGYKTAAVPGGIEAVAYLEKNKADLILLDMIMDPGINGRETYERIIKIHPHQKAIIVSGFAETDDVKETQRLGAGPYIKKAVYSGKNRDCDQGRVKKVSEGIPLKIAKLLFIIRF